MVQLHPLEPIRGHMNWIKGRQNTGYLKCLLSQGKRWDCYLIKYPVGSFVPHHTDPVVEGFKHYRLNIVLKGEYDAFSGKTIFRWWKFIFFRPDIMVHSVFVVKKERLVLSIGWLKKC